MLKISISIFPNREAVNKACLRFDSDLGRPCGISAPAACPTAALHWVRAAASSGKSVVKAVARAGLAGRRHKADPEHLNSPGWVFGLYGACRRYISNTSMHKGMYYFKSLQI